MSENLLMAFQTYEEFPEGILEVEKNSNIFIVIKDDEKFIVRQNIDQVSFEEENGKYNIISKLSFYDVIDDSLICCVNNINGNEKIKNNSFSIQHLSEYLGLKEDQKVCLGLNDIKELTKKDKQKTLKKN